MLKPLVLVLNRFTPKAKAKPIAEVTPQELWDHLSSSPSISEGALDRTKSPGVEGNVITPSESSQEQDGKRSRTLEWACERQTKRRRANPKDIDPKDLGPTDSMAASSDERTQSALSLLALAAGTESKAKSPSTAASRDVMRGASLLLCFKHSLRSSKGRP
ncbi:hypothetical protein BV22DRAFT_1032036 [Leucogyrophana mollusca]|uniref:Uncharacterized protein n=1 Tax=Leucogyrophana mollusca TaxID=85980 RepID=A0ACB8BPV0_9AGAM|nr:hypothetical protein BV22DRAFT_1032036 [Leucogyrophana mollusca]